MENDICPDQDVTADVEVSTLEIEELQRELHISKALVVQLNNEKERHYQEMKNLEQQHSEEMLTKDNIIVNLKRELDKAHEKIEVLESKMRIQNLSDPTNDPTNLVPAGTLSTLMTEGK